MPASECLSEEVVIDFVEGNLSADTLALAERHLDECGLCSDLVAAAAGQLSRTATTARGIPDDDGESSIPTGYRVLEPLGSGGMGIVYRAVRLSSGEPVALKTVPVRSADALSAIRREISSLSRLDLPGVVRILDQGVVGGRPWYAMELIEGETFEARLGRVHDRGGRRSLDVGRADWNQTFEILSQVCEALAHLHAHGFVHCDLTPRNIMVGPSGRPVLVDFGLTQRNEAVGRDLLDIVALGGGTVAYMAPEQIRGELLDARTDLYALGCLLYRTVTGNPVFLGSNPLAVLRGHLESAPVPPSLRADGVPAELEQLILQLLQKKPQSRLGYADDVADALRRLFRGGDRLPRVTESYLYRPELVGREKLVGDLEAALDRLATTSRGGRFHVGGESGVGKTRLAVEAVRIGRQLGLTVIVGHCGLLSLGGQDEPSANRGPLHPVAPLLLAIADRCRERGTSESARLLGSHARVLAAFQPALLDLVFTAESSEPVTLDPQAARARVLEALRNALFAFAVGSPVLLVLDDLQWADELTLGFLQTIPAGTLEQAGIVLLGTFRIEELTNELERALDTAEATYFELPRLDATEVAKMASGMLALREAPAPLVALLARYCDGNPFFVAEYLRASMAAGHLARDAYGNWRLNAERGDASFGEELPLPKTLAALIERRLADLGREAVGIVEAASVLGRAFDVDLLLSTATTDSREGLLALDTLNRRQIIEEAGAGQLRFVHDKIREIAYERISAGCRRELHARAGSLLEARVSDDLAFSSELGHHFARAGVPEKAARYLALAGDHARAIYANNEALSYYSRARVFAEGRLPPEQLASIEEHRGDVLSLIGRRDEARAAFESALAMLREGLRIDKSRLLWKVARTLETEHRHGEALEAYNDAEGVLGVESPSAEGDSFESAWWHQWVQLQVERVWVHYWLADVDAMTARVERARPVIEQRGTPAQRARFFQALVHANMRRERYAVSEETVTLAELSLAAAHQTGDAAALSYANFVLAFQLLFFGAPDRAEPIMLEALTGAERVGDLALVGRCLTYQTLIHRVLGNVRATQAFAQRALEAATQLGMHDYHGAAHGNLAWAAWREGRRTLAQTETDSALAHWAAIATKYAYPFQWVARLVGVSLALAANDTSRAYTYAAGMADTGQHRLPDEVMRPLADAMSAYEQDRIPLFEAHIRLMLESCAQLGYC